MNISDTGIPAESLQRYIAEQIYTLPGTNNPKQDLAVALTGSRACEQYTSKSDVDLDVVCTRQVFDAVHSASLRAGLVKSPTSFFCVLKDEDWGRYFGKEKGRPHFSLTPLDILDRHFRNYDDVPLWIWTHARILHDPAGRLSRIITTFTGYPKEVLIQKIKYHWLLNAY